MLTRCAIAYSSSGSVV